VPQPPGEVGKVRIASDTARLDGGAVRFSNESTVKADMIIYATAYDISFPLLDSSTVGVLLPPEQLTRDIAERRSRRQSSISTGRAIRSRLTTSPILAT
jgi:hypothetical protein